MTSNRSYFNRSQFVGRFRRSAWMPCFIAAILFFMMPVVTAISSQDIMRMVGRLQDAGDIPARVYSSAVNLFEGIGLVTSITAIGAGIFVALVTWSYLNSRRQVDFYHALPLRRETLFGSNFAAGLAAFAIPYLVMLVLSVLVFAFSVGFGRAGGSLWSTILIQAARTLLTYLTLFTITTLACSLCGNLFVSFCGTGVFLGLPAALVGLFIHLMGRYYSTFYSPLFPFDKVMSYISPVYDLVVFKEPLRLFYWLALSLVMAVVSCAIYTRRPSESAGRSIVFPVTRPFIKYPIILVATLVFGIFFEAIGNNSKGWLIFGFVTGALFCNAIIEIIFDFDLKNAVRGLKGLAIYGLIFAAGISVMIFDLTGYDARLPDEGELTAVSIRCDVLQSLIREAGPLSANGTTVAYGEAREVLDYYTFSDPAVLKAAAMLAKSGVEVAESEDYEDSYYYNNGVVITFYEGSSRYTRWYRIPTEQLNPVIAGLFETDAFRQSLYCVFTSEPDDFDNLHIYDCIRSTELKGSYSSDALRRELMEALRSDIMRMSSSTLRQESSLFNIVLTNYDNNSNFDYERRIPVYSSFISTLAVLEKYSVPIPEPLTADEVTYIDVNLTNWYEDDEQVPESAKWFYNQYDKELYSDSSVRITDKAEIARLLPMLILTDNAEMNMGLLELSDSYVFSVSGSEDSGGWYASFGLSPEHASSITVGMAYRPSSLYSLA